MEKEEMRMTAELREWFRAHLEDPMWVTFYPIEVRKLFNELEAVEAERDALIVSLNAEALSYRETEINVLRASLLESQAREMQRAAIFKRFSITVEHGEEIAFYWKSPWNNKREKIANFWWPAHPPEETKQAEDFFEQIAKAFVDEIHTPPDVAEIISKLVGALEFSAGGCLEPPDGGDPCVEKHIENAKAALDTTAESRKALGL